MTDRPTDVPVYPSAEQLVAAARNAGWDFFDGPGGDRAAAARAKSPEYERVAALAATLWTTEPFRDLLAWLLAGTLHKITFLQPLGLPADQAYAYGVFREGQNATVFALCKLIADGQKLQLKGRDT